MSNISWMYKNLVSSIPTITETFGTSNSDYGTNNMFDNNLQTYWSVDRLNLTTPATVIFDFGSNVNVDSLIVVHNLNSGTMYFIADNTLPVVPIIADPHYILLGEPPLVIGDTPYNFSDIPMRYGTSNTPVLSGTFTNIFGLPILGSTGTSTNYINDVRNYRYWELFLGGTNFSEVSRINEVFIGRRDTLPINPEWPFLIESDTKTIVTKSETGHKYVYKKYDSKKWSFRYSGINQAEFGTLNNMRSICNGGYKPFFMCIDKDDNKFDTKFIRFSKGFWKSSEVAYKIYDLEFSVEEEF